MRMLRVRSSDTIIGTAAEEEVLVESERGVSVQMTRMQMAVGVLIAALEAKTLVDALAVERTALTMGTDAIAGVEAVVEVIQAMTRRPLKNESVKRLCRETWRRPSGKLKRPNVMTAQF